MADATGKKNLFRRTVHCVKGRIDFWLSVQRQRLESVHDQGPPLACCAHGSVRECRLHCNGRQNMRYMLEPYVQSNTWPCYLTPHRAFHFLLRSCILLLVLSGTIGSHTCRFQDIQFLYRHALVMRWGSRRFPIMYLQVDVLVLWEQNFPLINLFTSMSDHRAPCKRSFYAYPRSKQMNVIGMDIQCLEFPITTIF